MSVDTDLEKLRLRIGDTDVSNSGANAKFKDSELNYFLSAESSIAAAALAAVESWIARKSAFYDFSTDGQSFSRSQEAQTLLGLAKYWRSLGITTSLDSDVSGVTSNTITKVDGYSDDIGNDEVVTSTSPANRKFWTWTDDAPY